MPRLLYLVSHAHRSLKFFFLLLDLVSLLLERIVEDLRLKGLLLLGSLGRNDCLLLIRSQACGSVSHSIVPAILVVIEVSLHLIQVIMFNQLLSRLFLLVTPVELLLLEFNNVIVYRTSQLLHGLLLLALADGDLFFVSDQCLLHAVLHRSFVELAHEFHCPVGALHRVWIGPSRHHELS